MKSWPSPWTMTPKWDMTKRAAPRPTVGPAQIETTGTRDMLSTTWSQPGFTGRYIACAVRTFLTLPPPLAPSRTRIMGTRISPASCSVNICFVWTAASPEPPRMLKSSTPSRARRPRILAVPDR